jgi:hypothetical protein
MQQPTIHPIHNTFDEKKRRFQAHIYHLVKLGGGDIPKGQCILAKISLQSNECEMGACGGKL